MLNEIFNTKIKPENWSVNSDGIEVGTLIVDDEQYLIKFEPFTYPSYPSSDKIYNGINLAFSKIDENGEESEALTLTNKSASKVLGAIYNASLEKLKDYKFDAIIFIAVDHIEQRMRIYNWIAHRMMQHFVKYSFKSSLKIPNGEMSIVFRRGEFSDGLIKQLEMQAASK